MVTMSERRVEVLKAVGQNLYRIVHDAGAALPLLHDILKASVADLVVLVRDADACEAFVKTLADAKADVAILLKEIRDQIPAAQAELAEWKSKVASAKAQHTNVLASLASIQRDIAAERKKIDAAHEAMVKVRAA
jgi:chromosome segregation ATPase